jgi:hypothetical protein
MSTTYNIYCDESCHLEHDGKPIMVLGALWCPLEKTRAITAAIKALKEKHGLSPNFEIKWTKVSPGKLEFYQALMDYFFAESDLHFRAVVAQKSALDHSAFSQPHDEWYYKMFFYTLYPLFKPDNRYRIYLDIKDTRSQEKVSRLHEVLCNSRYDFDRQIIERIQQVRSNEVSILQMADLLIGAVSYANRGLQGSPAKEKLVQTIRDRSHYSLLRKTLLREEKFNIFQWQPKGSPL